MPYNKYYKQKKEVSYDEGLTWQDVTPAEYQRGDVYETQSTDCHPQYRWTNMDISADWVCEYVPPTPSTKKFAAKYSDGSTYALKCNSGDTLTSGETHPSVRIYSAMTDAIIGNCVKYIGAHAIGRRPSEPSATTKSLTSVTIPNSVISIGYGAFEGCTNLTGITIPNSVTKIRDAVFRSCISFTSVTIPDSVTEIGEEAFSSCYGLTGITLSNNLTSIAEELFYACRSLTSVTIPNSVTSIGYQAFSSCYGLTGITCLATTPPRLLYENAFANTNNCPIYVPASSLNAYKTATNWSTYASRIQAIQ